MTVACEVRELTPLPPMATQEAELKEELVGDEEEEGGADDDLDFNLPKKKKKKKKITFGLVDADGDAEGDDDTTFSEQPPSPLAFL